MRDTIVKLPTLAKAPNKFIRFIPSKVQTSSESAYCTTESNRTLFQTTSFNTIISLHETVFFTSNHISNRQNAIKSPI
ncbi:hypothetical protein HMPREF3156_00049 [Neisseria sp. HMSC06F02]|nr:hypothetical protein HMPREF3156_00049 [Neisseria sp. HMSC06F02]